MDAPRIKDFVDIDFAGLQPNGPEDVRFNAKSIAWSQCQSRPLSVSLSALRCGNIMRARSMSWLRLRPHRKVPTNHPNAKILRLIHTREVGRLTSCLSSDSIGVMDPPPAWTMGGGLGGALAGSCASLARNRSVSARFGLTASILCVKSRHMVTPTDEPAGWRHPPASDRAVDAADHALRRRISP